MKKCSSFSQNRNMVVIIVRGAFFIVEEVLSNCNVQSNSFQQLNHTNLLTVTNLPTILPVVNSQLYWFTYIFDFVFELNTRKFRKAPGKRLKCY